MKRGQPLKRRTPLTADPEKTRAFIERGRASGLRAATAPSDVDGPFAGPALSDRKQRERERRERRRNAKQAAARRATREAWNVKTRTSVCAICGSRTNVTGHHVIPLRILKAENVAPALWFDPRNHLALCMEPSPERCHQRHENWIRRVPRGVVLDKAPEAIDFADEVGLLHVFDREYPDEVAA